MIVLEGVEKIYPGSTQPAVSQLDLAIPQGDIVMLIGPSGCGKTTTLKMINRLIEPTAGRILLDGEDVTHVNGDQLRRKIGYVIQQGGLFPHFSIADNIGVVPKMLGLGQAADHASAPTSCSTSSASSPRPSATATRASSPAASSSASASPARSPRTRRSCSWTSPSARSTRSPVTASRTSSWRSSARWARRSPSSPTTCRRP